MRLFLSSSVAQIDATSFPQQKLRRQAWVTRTLRWSAPPICCALQQKEPAAAIHTVKPTPTQNWLTFTSCFVFGDNRPFRHDHNSQTRKVSQMAAKQTRYHTGRETLAP